MHKYPENSIKTNKLHIRVFCTKLALHFLLVAWHMSRILSDVYRGRERCIGNKCVNFTELTRLQGYPMCYIMYYNVIIYVYNKNDYT